MTKKQKIESPIDRMELLQHVRNVLIDNARTDTLVYGLLLSLADDVERGMKRRTLNKEIDEAIALAQEQFSHLFFDEEVKGGDE